jgi:Ca-activated chloride channel family protein
MNDQEQPYNGQIDETLLTAYALGQLDGPERALVEAALKTDHKAQTAVEEIRAVAGHLRDAVTHDEEYAPSAALREMIQVRLEGITPGGVREGDSPISAETKIGTVPKRRRWAFFAAASAAVLLLAVTIPSLPMFRLGKPSNVAMDVAPPMKSAAPAAESPAMGDTLDALATDGERRDASLSAMPEEAADRAGEPFLGVRVGEFPGKGAGSYGVAGPVDESRTRVAEERAIGKSAPAATLAAPSDRPMMKGSAGYRSGGVLGETVQETPAPADQPAYEIQKSAARGALLSDSAAPAPERSNRRMAEPATPNAAAPAPAWSHSQAVGPAATPLPYPSAPPASVGQVPLAESQSMPRGKSAGSMAGRSMVYPAEPVPPVGDPFAAPREQTRLPLAAETAPQQQVEMQPRLEGVQIETLEKHDVLILKGPESREVQNRLAAEAIPAPGGMGGMGGGMMGGYDAGMGYGRRQAEPAESDQMQDSSAAQGQPYAYTPPSAGQGLAGAHNDAMQRVTHGADPGIDGSIMQRMIGEAEQYAPVVENPFQSPVTEPESTVSADVDTASYANVRRFLENNQAPPPGAVRVEEMVNYFSYDYPQPKDDTPFSVDMETASCPWNETHRLVRIGLKAKDIDPAERGPSNLVFLLDVSGSMRDANKLPLVKDAMAMLVDQLTEDDRVSIVTYAGDAGLALEPTEGTERKKILERIEALEAGGSTHGSAGIQMAYDQAMANFVPKGNNRVILCTDGDLNVGITDDDELVKLIQQKASSGVFLTVVGFGTGNLKDAKLEQLADKGNGKYAYVDGLKEAKKVFSEQVSGSLVTVAKDVKIQIEFNPAKVESYRLIGYENRLLAAQDFADDMKDAGEIGAGHSVTFLYEVVPAKLPAGQIAALNRAQENLRYQRIISNALTEVAESGELLALKLRYKLPDEQQSRLLELPVMDSGKRFGEASSEFRFAAAVAAFGMLLRGSQYNQGLTFSAVEEFAAGAADNDREGRRGEFVDLVRRARTLYGDTTQVGADAIMVPSAAAEAAAEEAQAPAARE